MMSIMGRLRTYVGRTARFALATANVEPATVKALIRKPPVVHGGPRVRRWPWPRRRHFDQRDRRAINRLLDREMRSGGAVVYGGVEHRAYCATFARYLGGGYAHAVNSGTNAVYVALRALDLEPGSEVIVPPVTDPGGTMPVPLLNCVPVPADCDEGSLNTSADRIREVITDRTAAIIVAHVAGYPVDMDPILALAAERGIPVVEDCAQAMGAVYKGRMIGTLGTIAAFSTMFGKHHATGAQGGVVFTRDTLLFARARQAADRGKPHGALGTPGNLIASLNFNQDELSMAIGRVQLEKLPAAVEARRRFASLVKNGMDGLDTVSLIDAVPGALSSPWFLMMRLDLQRLHCDSGAFAAALAEEGIGGVYAGYPFFPTDHPWHNDAVVFGSSGLPWSIHLSSGPGRFALPRAHKASREIVRVDVHEGLGLGEARDLVTAVRKVVAYFSGS